jgi:c(7)-type cytochrome triheme protein
VRNLPWWPAAVVLLSAPVLAAAFPGALRIPPVRPRPAGPPPALFSHRTHATFGCYGCHPAVFSQEAAGFSHRDMGRGLYCGKCHDGALTFAVAGTACARCHVPP